MGLYGTHGTVFETLKINGALFAYRSKEINEKNPNVNS